MRFDFNRQIAVTGLQGAGKTVFLTALINHLMEHETKRLPLGKDEGVRITGFRQEPVRDWPPFEYEAYRDRFVKEHAWPVKTREISEYRGRFYRSDWSWSVCNLTLVDLPGERFADIAMGMLDFGQWSDEILKVFGGFSEYREHAASYLELCKLAGTSEEVLIRAYREVLAKLILHFRPMVTPSTFLLGPEGDYANQREFQWLVANRFAGLDEARQFTPLPKETRDGQTALAGRFQERYEEYKQKIVLPFGGLLASSHALAVLVDITTLLAGGLGWYLGNRALLEHLIRYVDPGFGLWGRLGAALAGFLRFDVPGIGKLAFVASKVDKAHADDRDKVLALLKDLVRRPMDNVEPDRQLAIQHFNCAAVKSTESHPNGKLEARMHSASRQPGPAQGSPSLYEPSRVPEAWPDDWNLGDYKFPRVLPYVPPNRTVPPPHLGLDRVVDFLLSE